MVAIAKPEYIVTECTKAWVNGEHASDDTRMLAEKFELICNANASRGYALESWEMAHVFVQTPNGLELSETIIAVFKRCKPA